MDNTQEAELIRKFLSDFKKMIEDRTGIPFNPRHLAIITQPDMKDFSLLEWIAYHKWFDEVQYGISTDKCNNLIQVFLEMPLHILIAAEELGKPLLSQADQKKLTKALKLISEIRIGKQYD
jgi:ABC-type uncharacterized transport system permease subunit